MKQKNIRKILIVLIVIFAIFDIAGFWHIQHKKDKNDVITREEAQEKVKEMTGEWKLISPKGAKSSDGSSWQGLYKEGSANKTLVYFVGGGMSYSAQTDELNDQYNFYESSLWYLDQLPYYRIFLNVDENPFKDWNFIVVPYSTGDFHIGQSELHYGDKTVYHQGYTNFTLLMKELEPSLKNPDSLVITGSSAGGFAAALLAQDVMDYFPNTDNVTCFVDAGFHLYNGWKESAETIWQADEKFTNRMNTDNIVLDSLKALQEEKGEHVKILFGCSTRDSALQSYQSYVDTGIFMYSEEAGDTFFHNLKEMVAQLELLKNSAVYIFDTPVSEEYHLTQHMILPSSPFIPLSDDTTPADWLMDAVNGNLYSCGKDLLNN